MKTDYKRQELNFEQIGLILSIMALIVNFLSYQAKVKTLK